MTKRSKRFIIDVFLILFLIALLFTPLTYRACIDGVVFIHKIPLYAKAGGFLYRDAEYRRLAHEITGNIENDEGKALAVYDWTIRHIRENKPDDWSVVDDHTLNIVIRGYGATDQMADVFTTLCAYSGMRSFCDIYRVNDFSAGTQASLVLSFVEVGGRWLVFDIYNRKYFLNSEGKIATLNEIMQNPELIKRNVGSFKIKGIEYPEFFKHLESAAGTEYLRPEKQMPGKRILFELSRILK